jgi:magnesium transporter
VIGLMTVIGGFYGMNFAQTWPPFDAPWGVPLVLIMMMVIGVGVWAYFRWREWA